MNKKKIDEMFKKVMMKGKCKAIKEACERVVREKPEDNDFLIKDFEERIKSQGIYYALQEWCKLSPVDWFDDNQEKYIVVEYGYDNGPSVIKLPDDVYVTYPACINKEYLEEFVKRVGKVDLQQAIIRYYE